MKLKILLFLTGIFMLAGVLKVYGVIRAPDIQCKTNLKVHIDPAIELNTAKNLFLWGNSNYDFGDCKTAIFYYTKAIELDPTFAEVYNNRAYTNMRLRNYQEALIDLDKAITLRPDYVNALMNRGDLYNYYGPIIDRKKAIQDYNKVISLGKEKDSSGSVCGHKSMAETNNIIPLAFLKFFTNTECK